MFVALTTARQALCRFGHDVDVDALTPAEARAVVSECAAIEKAAACTRLRALRRVEADGETVDWLAKETGQSKRDAERDVETAGQVLPATDEALRDGSLSADQAREVASGAAADPSAEQQLLDSARDESLAELRRRAKTVRAAATDEAQKHRRAHAERNVSHRTDPETGKATITVSGPTGAVAKMLAFLEPFTRAEFDKARRAGRRERRRAMAFDALLAALGLAANRHKGGSDPDGPPVGPPVQIIARVDITALLRGCTVAGETCDIEGLGPVPVAALLELLPQAAIDVILQKGEDTFNVTHLGRHTTVRQQTVLHWLGAECARQGCGATRHLQIDHRLDWAKTHVTEHKALDWLCPKDHRRKTIDGWALVPGRGRRRMVPPDHPDHPANSPPSSDAKAA